MSQEMQAAPETPKGEGVRVSLRASIGTKPCRHLDFSLVGLCTDLQNHEIINVCDFKPLSLWYLVKAMKKLTQCQNNL